MATTRTATWSTRSVADATGCMRQIDVVRTDDTGATVKDMTTTHVCGQGGRRVFRSTVDYMTGEVSRVIDVDHIEVAWTFLDHDGLEPTNNGAERALRGPVIQRKLSWGSQSKEGLRLMERLWTTAETCRRQAVSVLDYITEAVACFRNGHPAPILVEC